MDTRPQAPDELINLSCFCNVSKMHHSYEEASLCLGIETMSEASRQQPGRNVQIHRTQETRLVA